ncbi:unnamed protein product [Pleuronectes platessa]|uniref:Uncharacterized protein n=1 Tax=Pleuronectes platessa TaxID=8262 RepID=A0A9N7UNK6_PLEPL|nr:unnamed protein product [Pleuronectes platessa]
MVDGQDGTRRAQLSRIWSGFVFAVWGQEGPRHNKCLVKYGLAWRHERASSAAIHPSFLPSLYPASKAPCCELQYNSFLCWLAFYEKLIVIAHRCHIRVDRRGGGEIWL